MQKTMLALGLSLAFGTSAFAEDEDFNPEFFFGYLGEDFGQSLEKLNFFHVKEIKFNEDLLGNQQEDAITFSFDNNDSLPAAWRGKKNIIHTKRLYSKYENYRFNYLRIYY